MKYLLVILFLVSCGQNKKYTEKDQINDFITNSEYLELSATKTYHPSASKTHEQQLAESKQAVIPNKIKVVSGNAGNYYSILSFDDVECYYKGGSQYSYPLQMGSSEEITKGEEYILDFCRDSNNILDYEAGDQLVVNDRVSLSIHNGDSTVPTSISVSVELLNN